jgi:hypothetical protein
MTPNLGQGGNNAIESAALLVNYLTELNRPSSGANISLEEIENCLANWEASRQPRARNMCAAANELTRLEAFATSKHTLIGRYLLPYLHDYLMDSTSTLIVGAEESDSEPLPLASTQYSMPYIPHYDRVNESTWRRIISTTPVVGCYALGVWTLGSIRKIMRPALGGILAKGSWTAGNGEIVNLAAAQ